MPKQTNGTGSSKYRTAAEDQADRRAMKAKQKARAGSGDRSLTPGSDLFSQMYADRRQQAQRNREEREAQAHDFRVDQARMAQEHEEFKKLQVGTVAHKMALAVFDAFPFASRPGSKRTEAACIDALNTLEEGEVMRGNAVRKGQYVARAALHWAYRQLTLDAEASDRQLATAS